ncbi:MAG TPA: hypothetical protein VJC18_03245 [bacterium]|nr:hypothetical protein [bacterium]
MSDSTINCTNITSQRFSTQALADSAAEQCTTEATPLESYQKQTEVLPECFGGARCGYYRPAIYAVRIHQPAPVVKKTTTAQATAPVKPAVPTISDPDREVHSWSSIR